MPVQEKRGGFHRIVRWIQFAIFIAKYSYKQTYYCIIAVDHSGLLVAGFVNVKLRIPIIYYSLELWILKDEISHKGYFAFIEKWLERKVNQRAEFSICQNEIRARILSKENQIKLQSILIVPHGPMGPVYKSSSEYFRNKYGIATEKTVILQAGSISPVSLSLELAQAAQKWPEEWILILHGFMSPSPYREKIRALVDYKRVILSLDMVAYDQMPEMIASADIGIAINANVDTNYWSTPSGKLANYVRCGLPVICSEFPVYRTLIDAYEFGKCVSNLEEMEDAIKKVLDKQNEYRDNAFLCYKNELEFGKSFANVIRHIDSL